MSTVKLKHLEQFTGGGDVAKIPLPRTAAGKVDRHCPQPGCVPGRFQIGTETVEGLVPANKEHMMRRQPNAPGTTCPYCGVDGDDRAFTTDDDRSAAIDTVRWAFREDIADMFQNAFKNVRNSRYLKVTSTRSRAPRPQPRREDLLRELKCDVCSRKYGTFGLALFCPNCGATNLTAHFARERELAAEHLNASAGAAQSEKAFRLLSNAHEDVVSYFEAQLKSLYRYVVHRRHPIDVAEKLTSKQTLGAGFQNVQRAEQLFASLGLDLLQPLSAPEREQLVAAIARRHVIAHNLGIVDEDFVKKTGMGEIGKQVPITRGDVHDCLDAIGKVITHLQRACPELRPTPASP